MIAPGNLTSQPGLSLTFDDWSRLRTATAGGVTTTYGVNGLNERVSKTDGTTTRVYVYASPGHLLGVYDGATSATLEELTYLGDRPTWHTQGKFLATDPNHVVSCLLW